MRLAVYFIIIVMLMLSCSTQSRINAPNSKPDKSVNTVANYKRADVARYAKKLLGTPYRYAGSTPQKGFDCSGFVKYVFSNYKINLPRSSSDYKAFGKALKPEEFKVGDVLVFYSFKDKRRIGHVGIIYEAAGMNSRFIHSSSVRSKGVIISELGSSAYSRRFYKCIDVIN